MAQNNDKTDVIGDDNKKIRSTHLQFQTCCQKDKSSDKSFAKGRERPFANGTSCYIVKHFYTKFTHQKKNNKKFDANIYPDNSSDFNDFFIRYRIFHREKIYILCKE